MASTVSVENTPPPEQRDLEARPRPSVVQAGILTMGGKGVTAALQMLIGVLIARWLMVSGRGQYQVAISFNTLAGAVLCLGIGQASIYLINSRKVPLREVTTTLIWVGAAMVLLYPAILFVIYRTHQSYFELYSMLVMLLVALGAVMPLVVNLFIPRLMAEMRAVEAVSVEFLQVAVQFAMAATLAATNLLTVETALLMPLVSATAGLAIVLWYTRRDIDLRYRPQGHVVRELLSYGVKMASLNVAYMAHVQAPALLLRKLLPGSFDQVGYYSNAAGLCGLISVIAMATAPLLYARWAGEPDAQRRARQAEITARMFLALSLVMATVIAITAPYLVKFLYTAAFLPSVPCLRLMVFGTALQLVAHTLQNLFYATGRALTSTALFLVMLTGNVLMIFVLVGLGSWGAIGAAISMTASAVIYLVGSLWLAHVYCGLNVASSLVPRREDFQYLLAAVRRRRTA